jgi:AraC-like DNA-binding protein
MNQFALQQGNSKELRLFPHILELGFKKNSSIQLGSFPASSTGGIRIYYVMDGKFEWCINHREYVLYPGDGALILPGHSFGSENGVLEIGSFSWIHLSVRKLNGGEIITGEWSGLSENESVVIGKILQLCSSPVLHKFSEAGRILKNIQTELFNQEIGYHAGVNHLLDELFIHITRHLTKQSNPGRDFPKTFMNLEQALRQDISHQWTVEEMAALVGLGTTLFNEKVKSYSGFSPINYLINIRISEAIKLLKRPDISLTDIALDTGFYSSQHFSTTFKRLTGYTPSEFRKNHLKNKL